jgi:multidrug resistance efflux pump
MTDPRLPTVDEVRHNRDVAGASTSEQLRQAQAALAASQADLSRVERDLSAVLADNQDLTGDREELVEQKLALKADLATATRELEQLRALHAHCPTRERQ